MRQFSKLEQRLLNEFQQGMPLTPNPYADIARQLGVYETTVLETLKRLQTEGAISRVGAVFRPNRVGASTLAWTSRTTPSSRTIGVSLVKDNGPDGPGVLMSCSHASPQASQANSAAVSRPCMKSGCDC